MDKSKETQILDAEERLAQAMLASDTAALDRLLAPQLIFTNHLGQVMSKQDDLAAHNSGLLKVDQLEFSERRIELHEGMAVVSVRTQLSGSYDGQTTQDVLRFTRVWALSSQKQWHLVAAHSCVVA